MEPQQQLIIGLFFGNLLFILLLVVSGFVIFRYRKPIGKAMKLRDFMWRGYIIARLVKKDKTVIESVLLPDKEGIRFKGIEGLFVMNDATVVLRERKYPEYTWIEGETAPVNYDREWVEAKAVCNTCKAESTINVLQPKSINEKVLDNLILKIKSISTLMALMREFYYVLIGLGIVAILLVVLIVMISDFKRKILSGEFLTTLEPIIKEKIIFYMSQAKTSIVA